LNGAEKMHKSQKDEKKNNTEDTLSALLWEIEEFRQVNNTNQQLCHSASIISNNQLNWCN